MSAEVVIYGASGYTGKLIAWHMAEYGIPFIAAGRSQQRLTDFGLHQPGVRRGIPLATISVVVIHSQQTT